MRPLTYLDEYGSLTEDLLYSSKYDVDRYDTGRYNVETLQNIGNILTITDPSKANIYIDGVLQIQKTSVLLTNIPIGNRTVQFTKAGYAPYTEIVAVKKGVTVRVASILTQIVNITDSGIVVCTGLNISSCPISPISCPVSVTPLNYANLIAILNAASSTTLTVTFIYTLNDVINYANVSVNLVIGTNIIYAFPTNIQYSSNAIVELKGVTLS